MSKYIIKNCPCYDNGFCTARSIYVAGCSQCTDCAMKQIVELCKEDLKPVRAWQEGDTILVEYKKDVHLARDILQLLDIREVE